VTSGAVPRPAMVGLGNLGGRMVIRLASTGAQVVGHDVRPGRARVLGIADAGSLAAACGERDVVDEDGRVATLVATSSSMPRIIAGPGATALTRMPSLATSSDAPRVRPMTACLPAD
jgi:3-hydroxyisobutyrate dehydrogenase-like beta-hydroxyacid dehydrogenase